MWRRKPAATVRKSLRHKRAGRQIVMPQLPEAQNGFNSVRPLLVIFITLSLAISTLWIVANLIGVDLFAGHSPAELSIELAVPRADMSDESYMGRVSKNKLYISVELSSSVRTDIVKQLVGMSLRLSPKNKASKELDAGTASIHVGFFDDKLLSQVAKKKIGEETKMKFIIYSNRELITNEHPEPHRPEQYKVIRTPTLDADEVHSFNGAAKARPRLAYIVESDFYQWASPNSTLEAWIPIHFMQPLEAQTGLAQLEWRQSIAIVFGYYAIHKIGSRVSFDRGFDDIKVSSASGLERSPSTLVGFPAEGWTSVEATNSFGAFQPGKPQPPVELEVHAASSRRKDLLDFIVFGLAALFGAAIAVLTDSVVRLVRAD